MTGDYLARGALVMTEAELARLERELLHDRPRPVLPAEKPALTWTDAEMRAAEQRLATGQPLSPPGSGKPG